MTRKRILVAVVAILALGTPTALAFNNGPQAMNGATAAQETTTAAGTAATTVGGTTTAAATANVTFTDQASNGTAVVVERVVVPEGGFVVIHAAESAAAETATATATATATETTAVGEQQQQYVAGAVLGNSTYLEPGVHENVTVELDRPLEEGQVLIAMPHRDTNDNRQYDFPEADAPYTQDGQPVTDWAFVTLQGAANGTTAAAGTETTTEEM